MKFQKAMVRIIDLGEEEILTSSGCTTSGFIAGDNCDSQNHYDKFADCTNDGHMFHGGQ